MLHAMQTGLKPTQSLETTLERQNNETLDVLTASACVRDDQGSFVQGMLILLDITARNQMQRELKREAELTRILIDHAPVSIGLLGTDGSVVCVNAAAEKLFGYKLKVVAGRKVWTLPVVDAAEASASQRRIEMLADGGGSIHFTRPMHTRDGGTRHIEIAHTAVKKADGSVDFIVTTGVDATERRKLEVEVIRVAEQEHIASAMTCTMAWGRRSPASPPL
jgi:PAS domain S-box-containing protein